MLLCSHDFSWVTEVEKIVIFGILKKLINMLSKMNFFLAVSLLFYGAEGYDKLQCRTQYDFVEMSS